MAKLQHSDGVAEDVDDHIEDGDNRVVENAEDDGSLNNDSEENPRAAFLDQFTTEESDENADIAKHLPDKDEAAEEDEDDEAEEPDVADIVDDEEENTEEEVDLGVDLSDLEDDADSTPEDFDPLVELPKKVWNGIPKEARTHLTNTRRYIKQQDRRMKSLEPQAKWTNDVLSLAKDSGVSNEETVGWLNLGFKANQGDEKAIALIGQIAEQGGYTFTGDEQQLDLEPVRKVLDDKVKNWELDPDLAREVMKVLEDQKPAPKAAKTPTQQQQQQQQPRPQQQRDAVAEAAMSTIQEADKRFSDKFGAKWPELRERVRNAVVLEQASNPVGPQDWPKRWMQIAKAEASKYLKRSERSKLRGNSESIGASSIGGRRKGSKANSDDPRESFHSQFSS
jgi:hypothetical protein